MTVPAEGPAISSSTESSGVEVAKGGGSDPFGPKLGGGSSATATRKALTTTSKATTTTGGAIATAAQKQTRKTCNAETHEKYD